MAEPDAETAAPAARLSTETFWLLAAQLVTAALAFLVTVVTSRALGVHGRGELAFWLQVSYAAAPVLTLGLDRSLAAEAPDAVRRVAATVGRYAASALVASFAVLLAVHLLTSGSGADPSTVVTVSAVVALAVGGAVQKLQRGVNIAIGRNVATLRYVLAAQAVSLALVLGGLALDVATVAPYLAALAVGTGVPALAWCLARARHAAGGAERRVLRGGLPLVPGSVAHYVGLRADRLLIPLLLDYSALGVYSVASTLSEVIAWPAIVYADAMVPRYARGVLPAGERRRLALLVGGGLLLGVTVAPRLVVPVFGADFAEAARLVVGLSVAAAALGLARVAVNRLVAVGQHQAASRADLLGSAGGVLLYVALIPTLGTWGAVVGSGLSYLVTGALARRSLRASRAASPTR